MNKEFADQPVFDFLHRQRKIIICRPLGVNLYGKGWAWDDYSESFMPTRSEFPMYGNMVNVKWVMKDSLSVTPDYFQQRIEKVHLFERGFDISKSFDDNNFQFEDGEEKIKNISFIPDMLTLSKLLEDTLKGIDVNTSLENFGNIYNIHSQPTDSLFKPMMHRSDNFFAEQTLLMVSNERLGYMSDEAIIDTLLKTDLKDLPQRPRWVDGSGLSRYNLCTPQGFVYLLNKMKNEFSWDRLKNILPTGGEGTLSNYFKTDAGFIYAKTGTLSNNCALSGYLITRKGKLLIFSVLANNYITGATPVRQAVEKFLSRIREQH